MNLTRPIIACVLGCLTAVAGCSDEPSHHGNTGLELRLEQSLADVSNSDMVLLMEIRNVGATPVHLATTDGLPVGLEVELRHWERSVTLQPRSTESDTEVVAMEVVVPPGQSWRFVVDIATLNQPDRDSTINVEHIHTVVVRIPQLNLETEPIENPLHARRSTTDDSGGPGRGAVNKGAGLVGANQPVNS